MRTTELARVVHATTEACRRVVLDGSEDEERWLVGELRVAQVVFGALEIRLLTDLEARAAKEPTEPAPSEEPAQEPPPERRRVNGTPQPKTPAVPRRDDGGKGR